MPFRDRLIDLFSKRPAGRFTAAAGLFFLLIGFSSAQRINEELNRPGFERLEEGEEALRLQAFRRQRLAGDYVFEFQLEHKPRRGRTVRYDGIMWGSWNDQGAITRVKIFDSGASSLTDEPAVELIVQNGPEPAAWIMKGEGTDFVAVSGEEVFEPVLEGLNYSVFDLQMPFIFWPEYAYEGPELVGSSRVAQRFLMYPPDDYFTESNELQSVRIALDDTYDALLKVEALDATGGLLSKFRVESFKKFDDQYIVNRITLTDYPSKDRTSFQVRDAQVGVVLDRAIFNPRQD